jgi:DNA-binding PadR family transcriptional regulator
MPQSQLSTLDKFILVLIRAGYPTLYDIATVAGISIGASAPALARLHKRRLVRSGRKGVRNRQEYQLTRSGERVLDEVSNKFSPEIRGLEFESLARVVVTLWIDNHRPKALQLLSDWVSQEAEFESTGAADVPDRQADAAQVYRWIVQQARQFRVQADLKAAKRVLARLQQLSRTRQRGRQSVPKGR